MSGDIMLFPETWEEYADAYSFTDTEQVYTNGAKLIPCFRVEQWLKRPTIEQEPCEDKRTDKHAEMHACDCINRQAAIDALEREQSLIERPTTETRWFDLGLRKAQDVLSELPSAQPERPKGEWIATEYDTIKCGECGIVYSSALYPRKYCPNCGADMREANKK